MIKVGTVLYGLCGGFFGRDSYAEKRVEAIGVDWVIARETYSGKAAFANVNPEELIDYTTDPDTYLAAYSDEIEDIDK